MLELWAGEVTAVGNLYMDCFIMIPADYFVYVDKAFADTSGSDYWITRISTFPNEQVVGYNWSPNTVLSELAISGTATVAPTNWYVPRAGDALLVLAAQETAGSILADTVDTVDLTIYNRWLTHRHGGSA